MRPVFFYPIFLLSYFDAFSSSFLIFLLLKSYMIGVPMNIEA